MTRSRCHYLLRDLLPDSVSTRLDAHFGSLLLSYNLLHTASLIQIQVLLGGTSPVLSGHGAAALLKARLLLVVARSDIGLLIHDLLLEARSV